MTKDEAYKILDLDIDSGATEEQIKDGFKKAAKAVHPDLHPDDKDATVKMQNVNAAKEFLDNLEEGEDVEKVYEHQSQTYQQQTTGQDTQREGDDQRARQQARDERAERMRERDRIYEQERNEREAGRRQESDEWKGTYSENVHSQESKDVGDYYDKTAPQFSDYLKFTGDSDDLFYQRLSVLIKQMKPNSKILQDFIDTSKEMKTTVSEEQIIKKLVREATTLAKLYYFSHKRINPNLDLEYYSEVKKSFILVMEIFEDVKSFSGLNTELSLIRQALET
ncbi:MAG: J domain-containing protein, partial [Candidatus Dojkabacteria bacterium]